MLPLPLRGRDCLPEVLRERLEEVHRPLTRQAHPRPGPVGEPDLVRVRVDVRTMPDPCHVIGLRAPPVLHPCSTTPSRLVRPRRARCTYATRSRLSVSWITVSTPVVFDTGQSAAARRPPRLSQPPSNGLPRRRRRSKSQSKPPNSGSVTSLQKTRETPASLSPGIRRPSSTRGRRLRRGLSSRCPGRATSLPSSRSPSGSASAARALVSL